MLLFANVQRTKNKIRKVRRKKIAFILYSIKLYKKYKNIKKCEWLQKSCELWWKIEETSWNPYVNTLNPPTRKSTVLRHAKKIWIFARRWVMKQIFFDNPRINDFGERMKENLQLYKIAISHVWWTHVCYLSSFMILLLMRPLELFCEGFSHF